MDIMPHAGLGQEPRVNLPADYDPSLNGIGGWLIVIIIGRVLSVILGIQEIADCSSLLRNGSHFVPLLYTSISVDIVIGIILSAVILLLIFLRSIAFRILFVIQVLAAFLFNIGAYIYFLSFGFDMLSSFWGPFILSIAGGVVWIFYVYRSKRVKNTYIYSKTVK
jgi:hypothetical protein